MKRLSVPAILLAALMLAALPATAQLAASGTLTAASADCSVASSCLTLVIPQSNYGSGTVTLSGTFTATVQFEVSSDGGQNWASVQGFPPSSSTGVTSATAAGLWQFNLAGYNRFRVRTSAYTSGNISVYLGASTPSARANGAGGAGVGTGPLLFTPDNTFDIGASGASRPRSIYAGTSFLAPSGTQASPAYSFAGFATSGLYISTNFTWSYIGAQSYTWRAKSLTGTNDFAYCWAVNASPDTAGINTCLTSNGSGIVMAGTSVTSGDASGQFISSGNGVLLKATAALALGVPVKHDTANASQVVTTITTDTGAGIVVGVTGAAIGLGANGPILQTGVVAMTLGTGTCAIGNFVIVDTTTNGRVKCTATYTAGAIIGSALTAQAVVGSAVSVLVNLR